MSTTKPTLTAESWREWITSNNPPSADLRLLSDEYTRRRREDCVRVFEEELYRRGVAARRAAPTAPAPAAAGRATTLPYFGKGLLTTLTDKASNHIKG